MGTTFLKKNDQFTLKNLTWPREISSTDGECEKCKQHLCPARRGCGGQHTQSPARRGWGGRHTQSPARRGCGGRHTQSPARRDWGGGTHSHQREGTGGAGHTVTSEKGLRRAAHTVTRTVLPKDAYCYRKTAKTF